MNKKLKFSMMSLMACVYLTSQSSALADQVDTYSYDSLGRLVAVAKASEGSARNSQISYDAAGNRTAYTVGNGVTPIISIGAASANEGEALAFPVTLSAPSASTVFVTYSTSSGSAMSGVDFVPTSGTLTIAAGQAAGTITVPTIDDSTIESTESFTVNLSSPTGAAIGAGLATGSIIDNDTPSYFSVGGANSTEGSPLVFTVTRSGTISTTVTVNYATANGTAKSGTNYTAQSGALIFAAGETSKTISVSTLNNSSLMTPKTVLLNISASTTGASFVAPQGVGTVVDGGAKYIPAGTELLYGQYVISLDGRFKLVAQSDFNVVLYQGSTALWSTKTSGRATMGKFSIQSDGNLVLYNNTDIAVWKSNTSGHPSAVLFLQNDGNLVLYSSEGSSSALWKTNTCCH